MNCLILICSLFHSIEFSYINLFFVLLYFQLLVKGASERGAKRIRLHILTDGRDVLDGSSVGFVETIENDLAQLREQGVDARVASGGGRMYVTMDRYEVHDSVINLYCI
jgi:bisphosphoglycerate-independent phosphoglycerate mutase (AlkP superfamily)